MSTIETELDGLYEQLNSGEIDQPTFSAAASGSAERFADVDAEGGSDLATALSGFQEYVSESETASDGYPFDRTTTEYRDVAMALVEACQAAGSDIIVQGSGG